MFAIGGPRCPYYLYSIYLSKQPIEMRTSGRLYLTPKQGQTFSKIQDEWFTRNSTGKNSIAGIMKALVVGKSFEGSGKKLTNHIMRKTTVKKLKKAKIPESSIIKVTGHSRPAGLHSYDRSGRRRRI